MEIFLAWAGAVAGVVAAILAGWQVRISTKRSDVEWTDYKKQNHHGTFRIRNTGLDTAYKVTVQCWTAKENGIEVKAKKVKPGEHLVVVLPERDKNGPDPVDLPPRLSPRVPDEPPSVRNQSDNIFIQNMRSQLDPQWEMMKKHQDYIDRQEEIMRRAAEEQQVSIKVVWCTSKFGSWREDTIITG